MIVNMIPNLINMAIVLAFFLGFGAGIILLQVHLSRLKSKWPGIILPVISFGMALVVLAGFALFAINTVETHETRTRDFVHISQMQLEEIRGNYTIETDELRRQRLAEQEEIITQRLNETPPGVSLNIYFARVILMFAIFNIPTAVLIAVYAVCRRKLNTQTDVKKMTVLDL